MPYAALLVSALNYAIHSLIYSAFQDNDEYFYGTSLTYHDHLFLKFISVKNIARPGETISSDHYESRVGGKGANQAIAITRAGGIADFYGTIGEDGLWVKKKVALFGLNDSGIIVSNVRLFFHRQTRRSFRKVYLRILQAEH